MKSVDADFKKLELIHSAIKRIDNIDFDNGEQDTIEQTMLCIKEVSTGDFSIEMRKEFTGLVRKGLLEIYNKMMNQLNGEIIPPTPTFRPGIGTYPRVGADNNNGVIYTAHSGERNIDHTPVIIGSDDKGIKSPINTIATETKEE